MGRILRSAALVALLIAPTALAGTSAWDANWYTFFDVTLDATSLPACDVAPPQTIAPHVGYVQKYNGNSRLTGYRNATKGFETNFTTAVGVLRTFDMSLPRPCTPGAYRIAAYITTSQVPPTPAFNKGSSYVDLLVVGTATAPALVEASQGAWTSDASPAWSWTAATVPYGTILQYELSPSWSDPFHLTALAYGATLPEGEHALSVRAQTNVGEYGPSSAVVVARIDTTPPTVALVTPAPGTATVGPFATLDAPVTLVAGNVTLEAEASDPRSGVARVDFLLDGEIVGTDDAAPYSYAWDALLVAPGQHILTARGVDLAGNAAEDAIEVIVV